ncbi:MAG: flagellar assembly protein FliW, partial [Candidatus Thorarchaeota archaeon]
MSEGFVDINSLEVSEKDIINIKGGLIGMPELKRFILMEFDEASPLHWLQSLDDSRIGFVVSDPSLFSDNYTVT